ncbi:MAG TPA: hypothetical protein VF260_10470 [Bacilli bacterium]
MTKETHEETEQSPFPPRRVLHPSNKAKMAKIFYGSLFVLFLSLVVGLIVWGIRLKSGV